MTLIFKRKAACAQGLAFDNEAQENLEMAYNIFIHLTTFARLAHKSSSESKRER